MNKYHWQGVMVTGLLIGLGIFGNNLATINNETNFLISQSEQSWQQVHEYKCRVKAYRMSDAISGRFFNTRVPEKIYYDCINCKK